MGSSQVQGELWSARAIRTCGEDMVRGGIAEAIRLGRQSDDSFMFANEWRFMLSRVQRGSITSPVTASPELDECPWPYHR